jgi:hypothetical protein
MGRRGSGTAATGRFATNDRGTVFGPLVAGGSGIRHWRWGTNADGTFQFEIGGVEARGSVPGGLVFNGR